MQAKHQEFTVTLYSKFAIQNFQIVYKENPLDTV